MSHAFLRRFAFVHVPIPDDGTYDRLLDSFCAPELDCGIFRDLFLSEKGHNPLMRSRGLGPAIAQDMARYLKERGGKEFLHEAIALYIVPQLEGLETDDLLEIYAYLRGKMTGKPEEQHFVEARVRELYPFIPAKEWENSCVLWQRSEKNRKGAKTYESTVRTFPA